MNLATYLIPHCATWICKRPAHSHQAGLCWRSCGRCNCVWGTPGWCAFCSGGPRASQVSSKPTNCQKSNSLLYFLVLVITRTLPQDTLRGVIGNLWMDWIDRRFMEMCYVIHWFVQIQGYGGLKWRRHLKIGGHDCTSWQELGSVRTLSQRTLLLSFLAAFSASFTLKSLNLTGANKLLGFCRQ